MIFYSNSLGLILVYPKSLKPSSEKETFFSFFPFFSTSFLEKKSTLRLPGLKPGVCLSTDTLKALSTAEGLRVDTERRS